MAKQKQTLNYEKACELVSIAIKSGQLANAELADVMVDSLLAEAVGQCRPLRQHTWNELRATQLGSVVLHPVFGPCTIDREGQLVIAKTSNGCNVTVDDKFPWNLPIINCGVE